MKIKINGLRIALGFRDIYIDAWHRAFDANDMERCAKYAELADAWRARCELMACNT